MAQPDLTRTFGLVIMGGGPAGTGLIVCAAQQGRLDDLLERGVCVIEQSDSLTTGTIGSHSINSDTVADVLLECLRSTGADLFAPLRDAPSTAVVESYSGRNLPLTAVGDQLSAMGRLVTQWISEHDNCAVLRNTTVDKVVHHADGTFSVTARSRMSEQTVEVRAHSVVSAMGGWQDESHTLRTELLPGLSVGNSTDTSKIWLTSSLFTHGGSERAKAVLDEAADPTVVIVGSSHSAFLAAALLLQTNPRASIRLWYRRVPRVFYPTREDAELDGYGPVPAGAVCPTTGRVNRLGGLRFEGRDLYRRCAGLGDTEPHPRMRLGQLEDSAREDVVRDLTEATLVIPAFGYRPRTAPWTHESGSALRLFAEVAPGNRLVDGGCRLLDAEGDIISGAFGVGLASGFVPHGPMGGEPDFVGQTNGLWLYQNKVGERILDQVLVRLPV